MELTLAQVGCRCGRRFAPLLQLLGIDRGSRVSPGLARRAAELATELPFARAAAQLLTETGHGLSPATVRRIVARAGERCDLTLPRSDVGDVPAMLIDGTRVPAGPRHGRARSARGVEVNIACAVMGRDVTGRRPRASMELLGASVAQPWLSLHDVVRSPKAIGIVVTDGDNGIDGLLDRALPEVPRQHCTFHVQHNIRLRLWQDGVAFKDRGALTVRLLAPILTAPTRGTSLRRSRSRSLWPTITTSATPPSICATSDHSSRRGRPCATHAGRGGWTDGPDQNTRRACWNAPCVRSTAASIPPAIAGSYPGCARWCTWSSPVASITPPGEDCGRMPGRSRCGPGSVGQRSDPLSNH